MLDTWPPLPIDIWACDLILWDVNNIVAALEHNDRIHKIELWDSLMSHVERAFAAMQKPFPSLTELAINFSMPNFDVPDSFLSGSVPPTSSNFAFGGFQIPDPFHPRGWSLAFLG